MSSDEPKFTPRDGYCWPFRHKWSKWDWRWHGSQFQQRACLKCGRVQQRWVR